MDIQGHTNWLRALRRSPKTIAAYEGELRHFEQFLQDKKLRVTQVTPRLITDYLNFRDPAGSQRPVSVRRRLSALTSFFEFVYQSSDGRQRNPVRQLRWPRKTAANPKPVHDAVCDALIRQVTDQRDRAIIMLLASSGLRLSELVSLDRNAISVEVVDFGQGVKRVVGVGRVIGKGDKEREFLADLPTMKQIKLYHSTRTDIHPAMFVSNRGGRMTPRAIEHMLHAWCRRLGLPPVHPHAIRHHFSTMLYRLGVGLLEISKLLGHSSVATTQIYVKPDPIRIRAEYFAARERLANPEAGLPEPAEPARQRLLPGNVANKTVSAE